MEWPYMHAWDEQHTVDWEGVKILEHEQNYWKRRTLEAIWIKKTEGRNSNLDCGLMLNQTWLSYIHYRPLHKFLIHLSELLHHVTSCLVAIYSVVFYACQQSADEDLRIETSWYDFYVDTFMLCLAH